MDTAYANSLRIRSRITASHALKTWRQRIAPGFAAPGFAKSELQPLGPSERPLTYRTAIAAQRALGAERASWQATLALTGPAVVASVAYIDPGNIATNVAAGSHYGYDLLWVVLLANAIAIFIQCLAAKLGIATGHNLAELSRVCFSWPVAWAMWVCSELVAMATDLAEFTGAAIGFALLLNTSLLAGMVITGCATCTILGLESRGFRPMELAIGGLVAVVGLSFLAELLLASPAWRAAAYHLAIPVLPDKGATILAIAIVGATVMPHALYVHSGLTQNRLALRTNQQRLRLLCFSNREVLFALGVASFINLAMVALAAAVFHDGVHNNLASIEQAYRTLIPLLGGGAAVTFMLALIGSGVSSSVVGTMAGQIVMQGFVGFHLPIWLRRALTALPAFAVVGLGVNATHALILSQIVLSLGLPIPMISLLLLTANKKVMGPFANSRLVNIIGAVMLVLILALNATLLLQTVGLYLV